MDQDVVTSLGKLKLTKEEEEDIVIANTSSAEILEEYSLSLFGRLLSNRNQNIRALKNTLRAAWKMGSELRIVEVGNNVLQFKFGSRYQLEWVEKSGPWNFENNLLLLCRWRKGLTSKNVSFSHTPFWVQIWGLPFENMSEDIGKEIGRKIGRVLEVDKRALQADQAKFLRVRVEVQIDKPLRRGGYVKNEEGERIWVDFRYERLPIFCYRCGILGHDEKHCHESSMVQPAGRQYGEWLKAGGVIKAGGGKEKLNKQNVNEGGGSASMVVDGGTKEACEAENRSLHERAAGGGAEEAGGTVRRMEETPLNPVESLVTSSHRKQGEHVRWVERVPEASDSELEQAAREGQNGGLTKLVRNEGNGTKADQQVGVQEYGPVLIEDGKVSPLSRKEIEGLSGEKRCGLVVTANEGIGPIRPNEIEGLSLERTQPLSPGRISKQGVRGKIKKIAREKGKAHEVIKSEQGVEVSKKRKIFDDTFFISDRNIQKRLCEGEQEGGVIFFDETAVTAAQHRLEK
ncbi:uncharacterized protein LOC111987231 [Quercus suber]|uniref:uncharacterized protein LOC111987231 n=1 Tax=Quercus suber TaxID=58331 RepID=UPI000CE211D3|nr:uncharacterized protein LOC111987231 [Quercus suber]